MLNYQMVILIYPVVKGGNDSERLWDPCSLYIPYEQWGAVWSYLGVSQLHKSIWKIGGAKQTVEICETSDGSRVRTIRQIQIYHQMCEL